jgi:hypothetical protein
LAAEKAVEKYERIKAQTASLAEQAAAEARSRSARDKDNSDNNIVNDNSKGNAVNLTRSKSINKQRIAAYSTAMESIQADVEPIDQEEDIP